MGKIPLSRREKFQHINNEPITENILLTHMVYINVVKGII